MTKKTLSLQETLENLVTEEHTLRRKVRYLRVAEPIVSFTFLLGTWVFVLTSFYAFLVAQYMDDPAKPIRSVSFLENITTEMFGITSDPSTGAIIVMLGSIPLIFVVCALFALLLRPLLLTLTQNKDKSELPVDRLEALDMLRNKAKKVVAMGRPEEKEHLIRRTNLLNAIEVILIVVLVLCVFDMSHSDFAAVLVASIFLGVLHWGLCCISFPIIRMAFMRPESIDRAVEIAKEAEDNYNKELKQREADEKQRKREEKIKKGIKLFNEGKYEEARKVVKTLSAKSSGDICAIQILGDAMLGATPDGAKKAYKLLWEAKEIGFLDEQIRQAVDLTLDKIKPVVYEQSEAQLIKAYGEFLGEYYGSVISTCEPLVEFGHPDATMLTVVSLVQSRNNPSRYPEWLEMVRKAKRRGFAEMYNEIAEELIEKLESAIRYNEEYERERANRSVDTSFYYAPSGGISTWAEYSGWNDFRTGEPLYRVEGRIVNANGEEVSAAWWD